MQFENEGLRSLFQEIIELTTQKLTPPKIQNISGLQQKLKEKSLHKKVAIYNYWFSYWTMLSLNVVTSPFSVKRLMMRWIQLNNWDG